MVNNSDKSASIKTAAGAANQVSTNPIPKASVNKPLESGWHKPPPNGGLVQNLFFLCARVCKVLFCYLGVQIYQKLYFRAI